jgi:hypothetical protein
MWKKWQLCTVLFVATTLNYLDRQTMSILAAALAKELRLENEALGCFSRSSITPIRFR